MISRVIIGALGLVAGFYLVFAGFYIIAQFGPQVPPILVPLLVVGAVFGIIGAGMVLVVFSLFHTLDVS